MVRTPACHRGRGACINVSLLRRLGEKLSASGLDAPVTIATLGLPESACLTRPPHEVDSNVMIVFSLVFRDISPIQANVYRVSETSGL